MTRTLNRIAPAVALLLLLPLTLSGQQQVANQDSQQEQSSFGTEEVPGQPRFKHPLPVPDAVVQVLKTDDGVKSCLASNPLAPGHLLDSWFMASEVHLDGRNEVDLVVLPSFRGEESMCFQSVAGIGWFWIFRHRTSGYELALKAAGNGLTILETRNKGYRDIQTVTGSQAGRYLTTVTFRFDGRCYQRYQERTAERH